MKKSKFRQAKLLEEKYKEDSSDELISKDKDILAAGEKLKRKKGAYSYLVKKDKRMLKCLRRKRGLMKRWRKG